MTGLASKAMGAADTGLGIKTSPLRTLNRGIVMGYLTVFYGTFEFDCDMNLKRDLGKLKSMMGGDAREHPEWNNPNDVHYIDLCMTDDMAGIEWDGSEKSGDMADMVNLVIDEMRKVNPGFKLKGSMKAQGDEPDDQYFIQIDENGRAVRKEMTSLYNKYFVKRTDGKDDPDAEYFVLRLDSKAKNQEASLIAVRAFAKAILFSSPKLANDLLDKYGHDK